MLGGDSGVRVQARVLPVSGAVRHGETTRPTLKAWTPLALAAVLLAAHAGAAETPVRGLDLGKAAAAALARSPRAEIARARRRASAGALERSAAAFDWLVEAQAGMERTRAFELEGVSGVGSDPRRAAEVTQELSLRKSWRSGLELRPHVALSRREGSDVPGAAANRGVAAASLRVPLLRGWGGGLAVATEASAREVHDASRFELRHDLARAARDAVLAYWAFLGAVEQLDAFQQSEARAERLVQETRRLIEADERAPADLALPMASLSSRRAQRIGSEQQVAAARHELGLAMGAGLDEIALLPHPVTPFPEPGPDAPAEATAAEPRADVSAAQARERASERVLRAALRELRPRLDVEASASYSGLDRGNELGRLFSPLYRNVPSWSGSLRMTFSLPMGQAAARGAALQSEAAHAQDQVEAADSARRAELGRRLAEAALVRSRAELALARDAERFARQALDAEVAKFQHGLSTLFDTIQAEDGLTNAQVRRVGAHRRYAEALVQLAFEAGTLLLPRSAESEEAVVDVRTLLGGPLETAGGS